MKNNQIRTFNYSLTTCARILVEKKFINTYIGFIDKQNITNRLQSVYMALNKQRIDLQKQLQQLSTVTNSSKKV